MYQDTPLKRLAFEQILQDLNFKIPKQYHLGAEYIDKYQIEVENTPFWFLTSVTVYNNKISYLYHRFLDLQQTIPTEPYSKTLTTIATNLDLDINTRIAEVVWSVRYIKSPTQYSKRNRAAIVLKFNNYCKDTIAYGLCGIKPEPNDMLTCKPQGYKVDMPQSANSWREGISGRESFIRRLGMSSMKADGWCYGVYDGDCKLQPK